MPKCSFYNTYRSLQGQWHPPSGGPKTDSEHTPGPSKPFILHVNAIIFDQKISKSVSKCSFYHISKSLQGPWHPTWRAQNILKTLIFCLRLPRTSPEPAFWPSWASAPCGAVAGLAHRAIESRRPQEGGGWGGPVAYCSRGPPLRSPHPSTPSPPTAPHPIVPPPPPSPSPILPHPHHF